MPEPVRMLALAYAAAIAVIAAGGLAACREGARQDRARRRHGSPARRSNSRAGPTAIALNNGAVGLEILRDGRGAGFVMGAERGGGRSTSSAARSTRCRRAAISSM